MSLSYYDYQAYDQQGLLEKGRLSAETEQEVINVLKSKKLIPVKIILSAEQSQKSTQKKGISRAEMIEFTQGLTTLMDAQMPIDKALLLLEGISESSSTRQLIEAIRRDVKEGKTLSQAMEARENVFSTMYISIIRAGEEAGILSQLLPSLERFMVDAEETRRHIIGAMIYPAVLFVVGILSIIAMLAFVVPQFATLFEDAGTQIPPSAAFLLALSRWMQYYGWTLIFIPIGFYFSWKWWGDSQEKKQHRDGFLLRLPVLGKLLLYKDSANFARTLGSLLSAGIPLLRGLQITRGVIENTQLVKQLKQVEVDVQAGLALGKALDNRKAFPVLLYKLISVGEESGRTASILNQLAVTFDGYVKNLISKLVALLEPLLILFLGIMVGGIVITMLLAVFSINDVGM
ncbi:MAG: type II secretion system F family protein [gamma proteobacterium symbiont of Taylorina sp.]|nr:type II secretion system F family protein [gamma proteobacterium symbiont of Taylorina sp.]